MRRYADRRRSLKTENFSPGSGRTWSGGGKKLPPDVPSSDEESLSRLCGGDLLRSPLSLEPLVLSTGFRGVGRPLEWSPLAPCRPFGWLVDRPLGDRLVAEEDGDLVSLKGRRPGDSLPWNGDLSPTRGP